MIAMRLAEYVEHTTDVDGMLDRMTPAQFEEWCVKDRVEPIGHNTHMTALLAYFVQQYMAAGKGQPIEEFLPWLKYLPPARPQNRQGRQILDQIAGRR